MARFTGARCNSRIVDEQKDSRTYTVTYTQARSSLANRLRTLASVTYRRCFRRPMSAMGRKQTSLANVRMGGKRTLSDSQSAILACRHSRDAIHPKYASIANPNNPTSRSLVEKL
jgi:hypothetical protein